MSLLSKQGLVLKKIIKASEEDRKQDILQLGNYYKSYLQNLHVSGGCLYLDNGLVIPASLRTTMLHRLHEAHPGQFAMKSLATQYIWWPKVYREIQVHGENCIECVKAGKNLKPLSNHNTLGKLPTVEEPNQEMELDFAGPLPLVWGTKKYILVCVDRFSKFPSAQITSSASAKSIINFLSKYITLHGIPRTIRTDQGSSFVSKEVREFCHEHNIKVIFRPVGDHRATGLVERLIRTIKERLLVMAQERPKPSLESALLKIIKCLRTVTQQSLNCSPFEAHFGRYPNTIWNNLVKSPSSNNFDWNKTLLCIDKGRKLMSRERRHDWEAPDDIEDGDLDENSSSSDDISNAVRYVRTSAGSPVKVLSRAEKRDALGIKNSVLNNPPGKTTIYRKVQERSKSEPFYRVLKDEIVRESDNTVTLKYGKVIRKSDSAIKRQLTQKKPSPRKRDQLVKFYATKGLRKTAKPQRNVGFKSSRATQKKRKLQSKFEELDIARRKAAMNSSRDTLLREEEEQRKRLRFPIGLESDQESSPSGKPDYRKICENELGATNYPNEDISDDNASDLILLKELKIKTSLESTKPKEHDILDRTDPKAEFTVQTEQNVEMDKSPLIDLDSGNNDRDPQVTPQLVFLDTHEEDEKVIQETPFPSENPGGEPTEKSVEPVAMAEVENQQLDPAPINKKTKLSGTAKRKASSPVKSPPSKKLREIYTRQNTRPMRTRQPPKMLGERVFTSVVDLTDKNSDELTSSAVNTPPAYPMIEATSVEMESHQVDVVDLTTLTPPSTSHPTTVYLLEESFEYPSDTKPSVTANQNTLRKKVKFSPEVCTTQFNPSGLPSETSEPTSSPIVLDPYWLNTTSIISAIELLERPMTLEELRRWTINKAANRDAN